MKNDVDDYYTNYINVLYLRVLRPNWGKHVTIWKHVYARPKAKPPVIEIEKW